MQLNKYELQTVKNLTFYKVISIIIMCLGVSGIPIGLYISLFRCNTRSELYLNNALIGASLVVLAISYLMYHFLKIIEKITIRLQRAES